MIQRMSELQMDALREIANIGSGNASTVLSEATGKEVVLTVSALELMPVEHVPRFFRALRGMVVTVYASIGGEILGNVMLILPKESAFSLADLLREEKAGTAKRLSMKVQNILRPFSRSVLEYYLDAITKFSNIEAHLGELRLIATFGETIGDFVRLSIGEKPERIILLKTELSIAPNVKGEFSLFLPIRSAERLLTQVHDI